MILVASITGEPGEVTTTLLLLGIWLEKESAGYKIMATLGFDDEKAKELEKHVSHYWVSLGATDVFHTSELVLFIISYIR